MGKAEHRDRDSSLNSPNTEASKLLEAALQQMDGIISGVQSPPQTPGAPGASSTTAVAAASEEAGGGSSAEAVDRAVDRLVAALRTARRLRPQTTPPPPADAAVHQMLLQWLGHKSGVGVGVVAGPSSAELESDRVRRLQIEKEQLAMQASVLSERIDIQVDKMAELEVLLAERKRILDLTEERLQREILARSSLETQKLELLSAVTELKRQLVALSRENAELREARQKPPLAPRTSAPPAAAAPNHSQILRDTSSSQSPGSSPLHRPGLEHAESYREIRDLREARDIPPPRTPPATYRQRVHHFNSLPRESAMTSAMTSAPVASSAAAAGAPSSYVQLNGTSNVKKGVAFGKGILFVRPSSSGRTVGDRCSSTPNLAEAERIATANETNSEVVSPHASPSLPAPKSKGIKKIFGRMKRSGSGNLEDLQNEGEFKRGGVRATAGGRLGWTGNTTLRPQVSFAQWDKDAVCDWLSALGLETCAEEGRNWITSGAQLLSASPHELDKELGLKNQLHRKKLRLALQEQSETGLAADPRLALAGALDTCWVLRWLDDTGLPQLKDAFMTARVDGRVVHRLTIDDLAVLHVTSVLHVASLRTGIQVLRDHNFDPNCLVRRSTPGDELERRNDEGEAAANHKEVALWTNHRVMEWLRLVDLAEYAPNLRGSGVHGGLLVHETRFTADLLASLLSIPPSKTLLRRHLNTHFKELLGRDVIQAKRQAEAVVGYTPLTPTAKLKVPKKSQFSLKRQKTKSEVEFGDLVCPLDHSAPVPEFKTGDAKHNNREASYERTSLV